MTILSLLLIASSMFGATSFSNPTDTSYKNHCLSVEERKLYLLLNDYRKEKNLPPVALSKSLSYVAHMHMVDLFEKVGQLSHGWSTCAYNAKNSKTWPCMWLKPAEMTSYKAYGYECVYSISSGKAMAWDALAEWKKSTPHNNVIINKGIWADKKWLAVGVGIYGNYAAVWFGDEADTEDEPIACPDPK
jgi:hypothetical protein